MTALYNSMSSDESFLEELIHRIASPESETIDKLATGMVCTLVKNQPNLIKKCTELIISIIMSDNETRVLRALELLEECMSECGDRFQGRIDRFKFLNNLKLLVSEHHKGLNTPKSIKYKILDCLLLWTTLYPERKHIKMIYDILLKEGVEQPQNITSTNMCSVKSSDNLMSKEEEKLLKQLIQSKAKDDNRRANLLIKSFFHRDEKRTEMRVLIYNKMEEVKDVIKVLNEVIDVWIETKSEDSFNLMKDLHIICNKLKPEMAIIPEIVDEHEEKILADVIEANDNLLAVLEKCSPIISETPFPNTSSIDKKANLSEVFSQPNPSTSCASKNQLDELTDIFSSVSQQTNLSKVLTNLELLKPTRLSNTDTEPKENDKTDNKKSPADSLLQDIDKISESLLKENIPSGELIGQFKKETKRMSLNDLAKTKLDTSEVSLRRALDKNEDRNNFSLNNLEKAKRNIISRESVNSFFGKPNITKDDFKNATERNLAHASLTEQFNDRDKLICEIPVGFSVAQENREVLIKYEPTNDEILYESIKEEELTAGVESNNVTVQEVCESNNVNKTNETDQIKHLSQINIEINDIKAAEKTPSKVMYISGLQITINYALNKPGLDVSVIVVSVINQNNLPMDNYELIASVCRPCKVKTLPPTGTSLPAARALQLPTVDIQQILLLYNPTKKPVDITFVLGYTLGDDPDLLRESIIAKEIPYEFN